MSTLTISQAILFAQSGGLDRLDAQLLMLQALGRSAHDRAWLLTHDEDPLTPAIRTAFETAVQRRITGEPVAYITGHKEFFGLDLEVDHRVLVPRPDTETLVEWALAILDELGELNAPAMSVLDLGTGSGAIALALKQTRPALRLTATDASQDALTVARGNAQRLQLAVQFTQGSWFSGLLPSSDRFHMIVSNPPYIASGDTHLAALVHEPIQALTAGVDGLEDIRTIISQARGHLRPGGWLLLEHGYDQAAVVRGLLNAAGFEAVQSRQDINSIERCSAGRAI
jgi:release factor glutamine methyltransferase